VTDPLFRESRPFTSSLLDRSLLVLANELAYSDVGDDCHCRESDQKHDANRSKMLKIHSWLT
jgi:hypothetical protein